MTVKITTYKSGVAYSKPKALGSVSLPDHDISVADLAKKLNIKQNEVVKRLWALGKLGTTVNDAVDRDLAATVATDLGWKVERLLVSHAEVAEPEQRVALFDMDGTIADFVGGMERDMKPLEGPGESWNYDTYDQDTEPPFMKARRRAVKSRPGFWRDLSPYEPGFSLLHMAVEIGFRIVVFTKAPRKQPVAYAEKAEWCKQHLDPLLGADGYDIAMVTDKGGTYGRILVDDWPPYIERWLEHRPRGRVIMPAHGYNATFKHPQVSRYTSSSETLEEALKIMREAYER